MNQYKVAKFGGTSNQDAKAMLNSCRIVAQDPSIRLVVISALAKTTSTLRQMAQSCFQQGEQGFANINEAFEKLLHRHQSVANDLQASSECRQLIDDHFQQINTTLKGIALLKELNPRLMDQLMAHGEQMSSALFAQALQKQGVDSELFDVQQVMITNDDFTRAIPQTETIKSRCQEKLLPLLEKKVVVTQGFIGITKQGATTTLGLEGSDYSAALLAQALHASEIQIWTDVDGIYSADPRSFPQAQRLENISFQDAETMSFFGAKVLHTKTLTPARQSQIPLIVGHSQHPEQGFSRIGEFDHRDQPKALSIRKNQQLLHISANKKQYGTSFFEDVFKTLWHLGVNTEMVQISHQSLMGILDSDFEISNLHQDGLQKFNWSITGPHTLITLLGMSELTTLIEEFKNTDVLASFYGKQTKTLSILVKGTQTQPLLKTLHQKFVERG